VIECLKMATTGELPPSARAGQAFIHDPKVADMTEVKAQIKLRFRDVRHQPCVVTRSFQLTQKTGGKLEKKDLDQVIQAGNVYGYCVNLPHHEGTSNAFFVIVPALLQPPSTIPFPIPQDSRLTFFFNLADA
jgi:hypothetical protein